MSSNNSKILGAKIKEIRENKGLNRKQLGKLAGLSDQQIRRIEQGTSDVSAIVLARIAQALEKDIGWFVDHVKTIRDRADELWDKHGLSKKVAGSRQADFIARREILRTLGLWEE